MDEKATGGGPREEPQGAGSPADSPRPVLSEQDDSAGAPSSSVSPPVDALGQPTPTATRVARMRPVPEEFPTPPPRPADWNRRRAQDAPSDRPRSPRHPLVTGAIVLISILVLVVVIGGVFLLVRTLDPGDGAQSPAADPVGVAPAEEGAAPTVDLGGARITTLSYVDDITEVGGERLKPEGRFAILTLRVENDSESAIAVGEAVTLVDAEGTSYPADEQAGIKHEAESVGRFDFTAPGETAEVHVVFDLPEGTTADHAVIDLSDYPDLGTGELTLG